MDPIIEDLVACSAEHWVLKNFVLDCDFLFFADGPVSVGMSLDIASIDTISEINMVL